MNKIHFFNFQEHASQNSSDEIKLSDIMHDNSIEYKFSSDNLQYLALSNELIADYYIGMRWIEWETDTEKKRGVIFVKPKHDNIPFEKLLWTCMNHPIVCNHMDECYEIFPDETPIPVPDKIKDFIIPLLITDYLLRVQKIVKKGIMKGYVNVKNTFNNRIKGKVAVNDTIKHHLKKNSITQTVCSYQIHTTDCLENRILKAALLQTQKYIYRSMSDRTNIKDILHYNLTAFDEVTSESISLVDFQKIKNNSFYKEYKTTLALAKLILKTLGFSLGSDISNKDKTIPPFYINMPELFERYCEVLLRKRYTGVLAGYSRYGKSETRSGVFKLRPDFILSSENRIIDSKYKYWIEDSEDKSGLAQLSLYSRYEPVLMKCGDFKSIPKLQFIYPSDSGESDIDFSSSKNQIIENCREIYKYPIYLL